MASVALDYGAPPPDLADRVSAFYQLTVPSATYDDVERADRPQLRFLITGQGTYHFSEDRVEINHPITLMGPTSGPVRGVGTGPMLLVGAGLMPRAWVALAGSHAEHLTDKVINFGETMGAEGPELLAAMAAADGSDARFALLADFIRQKTASQADDSFWFPVVVDKWLADNLDPHVDQLIAETGLGMRQIERLTKRYYGLPPKTLSRRYRAVRAAAALSRGEDLSASGLGDSFYDQSHLIREIKRFAGLTPEQVRSGTSEIQTKVSKGLKSLEGQVPPLISDA